MEYRESASSARMAGAARQTNDYPVATYSLVLLNLILFIGTLPGDRIDLAYRYGLVPERLQFIALFTSTFLHFDPAHLLINITFLWLFGRKVERIIGPIEFLLFYIGSGFTASLLHVAITSAFLPGLLKTPVLGASGAISGVLGMYAIRFRRERVSVGRIELPAVSLLLAWLAIQAALGVAGFFIPSIGPVDVRHVGYWSHIGGFVFGMAAAWATAERKKNEKEGASDSQFDEIRRKTLLDVAKRYDSLAAIDPEDPFAYAELGRVWALLGNQDKSTSNYLRSIELYRQSGRHDDALASLHEALRFWPEVTLPHETVFRFACYFESLGEYEEAARRFFWLGQEARGEAEGDMSLLKLGQLQLDKLNHPEQAAEALDRLLADYPNSRWADLAKQLLSRTRPGD